MSGLIGLLVIADPLAALLVTSLTAGLYGVLYQRVSVTLDRRGRDRLQANGERFRAAAEAFGGIKEVKAMQLEQFYLARFESPSLRFSRHQAIVKTLSVIPRYLVEALAFGGMLLVTISMLAAGKSATSIIPLLGLYALAGSRILPSAQRIYAAAAKIRFAIPAAEKVAASLAFGTARVVG